MLTLEGKVAIVTGAAGGIGAACARKFVEAGAKVILTDVREEAGRATTEEITSSSGEAKFVRHDVTDETAWESVVSEAVSGFGGLDILVNNAGIEETVPIAEMEYDSLKRITDVNVNGVFLGHKHAARAMRPDGAAGNGGSIINLSSVAGLAGFLGLGAYGASKGAVRLLTKQAAVEFGQLGYGIRVNSVHPGLVDTDMGQKLVNDYVSLGIFPDYATGLEAFTAKHPVGRMGKPEDIANLALFLASDLSAWISGAEIAADGAMTAAG